ncbi:MAG: hypothetical protein AABZ33_08575 [Chloroflexota bacterium]
MTDLVDVAELDEQGEPGTSFLLTDEGWQSVAYEPPEHDWELLADGSFRSLDGLTRSFPLDNPAGD